MRCWRVDLRRNFSRYVNGELSSGDVTRVETHLLDCASCRALLTRIRSGHRFASQLPRLTPQRDRWRAIEAAIQAEQARPADSLARRPDGTRAGIVVRPSVAFAAVAIVLVLFALLAFVSFRSSSERLEAQLLADDFEALDFHPVSIAEIQHNTEPHVVAEGYVSEVRIDQLDGDLVFKLVDDVHVSQPFIICEILNPEKLAPPSVGSRVRVYGVSRYDNQENHNWYEVHPVLNIEIVR